MICGQCCTDVDQVLGGNPELDELGFRLDVGSGKMTAKRLRRVLDLGLAGTELNCGVAILVFRALGNDLYVIHPQYCYWNMFTSVVVDAGHTHFLCNHT
ncbi:hypothetical protein D3C78_1125250 [compost metagenome]